MSNVQPEKKETEWLVYRGNSVPSFIKVAWVILIIFCVYYLLRFMWPDLQLWFNVSR